MIKKKRIIKQGIMLILQGMLIVLFNGASFAENPGEANLVPLSVKAFGANEKHMQNSGGLRKWPQDASDMHPDPAVKYGQLPNGLRYALLSNHIPDNKVSLHLVVEAGSLHESDQQKGVAHFLEHMLFNGTTHFAPGELVDFLEINGMRFGADVNARTGHFETVYHLRLASGKRKLLEKGFTVMRDFADGALLLPEEIDRERAVIISELRHRDTTANREYMATLRMELQHTRISKRMPLGLENDIRSVNRALIKAYYDTWYRPEAMTLVMVGDFDRDLAAELIERNFVSFKARAPKQTLYEFGTVNYRSVTPFVYLNGEQGHATVSLETLRSIAPVGDSSLFQEQMLAREIADKMIQNRLEGLLLNRDAFFNEAAIGSGIYFGQVRYGQISAVTRPQNWEKALSLLEQTLRQAVQFGFNPNEFDRAKKEYRATLDQDVVSASTRSSDDLARMLVESLNNNRVFQSPLQRRALLYPMLDALTIKDTHRALKDTWSTDQRLLFLTGNADLKESEGNPETRVRAIYENSRKVPVSAFQDFKAQTFPYLPEPRDEGQIVHRATISDLGISQVKFANGVILSLKKTDFNQGEFYLNLAFGRGKSSEPKELPGLAALSMNVINESGLGALPKEALKQALAGTKTRVWFTMDEDRFLFKGRSIPEEAPLLFQLLYAYVQDTGYRQKTHAMIIERYRQHYATLLGSARGSMALRGKKFLAGGDSRFGLPSIEKFHALTLDQVQKWIEPQLENSVLELSLVGDFDPEEVIRLAGRYFGSLPTRSEIKNRSFDPLPTFPANQLLELSVRTQIPKSLLLVAFSSTDIWDIYRARRFSVLAAIFSRRMRATIREQMGASYAPVVFNRSSRAYAGYGVFQAYAQVDPGEVGRVRRAMERIVSDMATNGIEADELAYVLAPTIERIKERLGENSYWLNKVLCGSAMHPEQLEWSRSQLGDYTAITTKDLSRLAKKYLGRDQMATIIINPAVMTAADEDNVQPHHISG